MAYKNKEEIMKNIEPTAEILKVIKPIYNFKSAENSRAKMKVAPTKSEHSL